MIAKCICTGMNIDLTVGNEYPVVNYDRYFGMVRLKGDNGELFWYPPPRFVEVWE